MNVKDLIRLLSRHWLLLLVIPVTTAAAIYFFSRFQDKKYQSDTVLYTGISSGLKIDGGNSNSAGGWNATSTAFDNLLSLITSRETREEVALHLLSWQLMREAADPAASRPKPEPDDFFSRLKAKVTGKKVDPYTKLMTPAYKASLTGNTLAETTANVMSAYRRDNTNPIYQLINTSKDPLFSDAAIMTMVPARIRDSDQLRIDYAAKDPLVCQKTLEIMTQVFIRKNKDLSTGQNQEVIGYFNQSAQRAYERLQIAEQKLLAFHQKHNIVDYDKQILSSTDERRATDDQYNLLAQQLAGTSSTLKSAETTLARRGIALQKNQEIPRLRERLTNLNSQALELDIVNKAQPNSATASRLAAVKQEIARTSDKLSDVSLGSDNSSATGLVVKDVMADYTKNTLEAADLKSRLDLMRRQRDAAAGEYNKLVPLGAEIRKIRREVEVAEKEYLSQVEGLKQSKLSQQNGVLASQLRVVDPPYVPAQASGSKTMLLLIGGFMGAFLLTGAGVVATGLLDSSLQNPVQATKVTTFPVAGIIPKMTSAEPLQLAEAKRAEDHLARQLLLKFQQKTQADKPFTIGVLSCQSGEGKTEVCCSLAASLNEMDISTLSLFPNDHNFQIIPNGDTLFYSPLQGVAQGTTVADLAGQHVPSNSVVIVEFPALLETAYPASLLQDLDLILVAVRAERSWHPADKQVFKNIQAVTKAPIELVLNGVLPDYVADFIGSRTRATTMPYVPALPAHPAQPLLN
ncbi:MAG: hypothetical protein EOO37_00360 [Cytophagaceae bacterium]|nr:MAG: hypothetical protein EOO37_00360 [Cytophagaceae bacterium]